MIELIIVMQKDSAHVLGNLEPLLNWRVSLSGISPIPQSLISEMPKCLPVWRNFGLGFAFPELFSEGSSFYKKQNYSVRDPRI